MVTRLASPRLVTDSMGSGGTPHVSYGGGPPGSTPVEPGPQPFEVPDLAAVAVPAGRIASIPDQPRDPGSGQFSPGEPDQTGGWDQAGSDAAGWNRV